MRKLTAHEKRRLKDLKTKNGFEIAQLIQQSDEKLNDFELLESLSVQAFQSSIVSAVNEYVDEGFPDNDLVVRRALMIMGMVVGELIHNGSILTGAKPKRLYDEFMESFLETTDELREEVKEGESEDD